MKKMKKWKLLVVTALVFAMSAQTVLAARASKPIMGEAQEEVEQETKVIEGQVSENEVEAEAENDVEMQTEATFYYRGETAYVTSYTPTLTDINGNAVSFAGEARKVKVVIVGNPLDDRYTIDAINYLEQQYGSNPHVDLIAVDADGRSLSSLQGVRNNNFKKTVVTSTQNDEFWSFMSALFGKLGGSEGDVIYFPDIYVLDSENVIRYVSAGYEYDELGDMINYINQMDEVTGIREIIAFVNRLYAYALNREADEAGLLDWSSKLYYKQTTGNDTAFGFFFSAEMNNRNLSDGDFVELLYKVMMNRNSDPDGKAYWVNMLQNGVSRVGVFNGFSGSAEFTQICNDYGINRGNPVASEGRDKNYGATLFVSRLYTKALGRNYDVAGLNDWCSRIANRTWTVTDVATTGFFNSPEFMNKNLSNEEYVKVLYRTFLDREYDEAGLNDWVSQLNSGAKSRNEVLRGFSYSQEFSNLMKQYGL